MTKNLQSICEQYDFENELQVKKIICDTFSRKLFNIKPQAFLLVKAINVARTYLATNDMDEIIKWARE